ncbi:hypothetical protein LUZ60_010147 [Juncus effusus]|nr:hypothetical protein LUZ60_010147 [Juncus effusus]
MAKEKAPPTPEPARRSTRSSAASSPAKPSSTHKSLDASRSSFDRLISSLPGRIPQILALIRLIGPVNSPLLPLLLYGSASTGKTSTVVKVFEHLKREFVYISCRSCHNPRILFESVLNQLGSSKKRCDKASDFVNYLKEALIGRKKEMVYLIFDNIELVRNWDKGSLILSVLLRLNDIIKNQELGLIYISRATPDAFLNLTGSIEPVHLYFPDYTLEEIHTILIKNQPNQKFYNLFLRAVLKPFFRVTRRVDELASCLSPLYKKYIEPLPDLNINPDESLRRRLIDQIQPHITAALNETFNAPLRGDSKKEKGIIKPGFGNTGFGELEFHMSVSAKYLLVSAFLASRNPATLDAALFDSTGGSDRKRKRKSTQSSIDQNAKKAEDLLTKGPGTFPLERLLAIFQCITSVLEDYSSLNEKQTLKDSDLDEKQTLNDSNGLGLMSDVLLQISTLCNSNFITKSGSCPLDGAVRYRSLIDEDLALKVARSLNFPLMNYVYRR